MPVGPMTIAHNYCVRPEAGASGSTPQANSSCAGRRLACTCYTCSSRLHLQILCLFHGLC